MLQYLINASAIWLISLAAYDVFLKRESYHGYNRAYLAGTFLLGVIVPLLSWGEGSAMDYSGAAAVAQVIHAKAALSVAAAPVAANWQDYLLWLYIAGVVVSVLQLARQAYAVTRWYAAGSKSRDGSCIVIETGRRHSPFSLFNCVFVSSKGDYSPEEWAVLMAHEQMHGLLLHFADVLLFSVARIVFWFHPLVYVYQQRALLVHEFQADRVCAARPREYGQFLVEQSLLHAAPSIAHSFNRSPIKIRLVMLTRKSTGPAKAKMFVLIPVALVCLVCFTENSFSQKMVRDGNKVTFRGNTFMMEIAAKNDTVILTDPVSGKEMTTVVQRDPKPLTINGAKIYDINEAESNPVFDSKDHTLGAYLVGKIRKSLADLPDGSYNLQFGYFVTNSGGSIVYYDFSGIVRAQFSHGASQPVPEVLSKAIANQVDKALAAVKAKPARLHGKNVPVLFLEDKLRNSIDVKDHQVTNW